VEFHEREYFISRICAGYIKYFINPKTTLIIKFPDDDVQYDAQEVYQKTYESAMIEESVSDDDIFNFLIERNLWSQKEEDYLNPETGLYNQIDTFKIQLFESFFDSNRREELKKYLSKAKNELIKLLNIRHAFDYLTSHGMATFIRWHYIIENCTYLNGKLYNWKDVSIQQVMNNFQSSLITEEECRELSRSEPWVSIWAASKINGSGIFDTKDSSLTSEQKKVLMWSNLYDNVSESMDCPSQSVIDDDDMLDGWLLVQRRKREQEVLKKQGEEMITKNSKIANSDEIYIVAKNERDIEAINQLNNMQGKMMKRSRMNQVRKHISIDDANLPDVKQQRRMQAHKTYIDSMKGK